MVLTLCTRVQTHKHAQTDVFESLQSCWACARVLQMVSVLGESVTLLPQLPGAVCDRLLSLADAAGDVSTEADGVVQLLEITQEGSWDEVQCPCTVWRGNSSHMESQFC